MHCLSMVDFQLICQKEEQKRFKMPVVKQTTLLINRIRDIEKY
jgi:hypothetical protein